MINSSKGTIQIPGRILTTDSSELHSFGYGMRLKQVGVAAYIQLETEISL